MNTICFGPSIRYLLSSEGSFLSFWSFGESYDPSYPSDALKRSPSPGKGSTIGLENVFVFPPGFVLYFPSSLFPLPN